MNHLLFFAVILTLYLMIILITDILVFIETLSIMLLFSFDLFKIGILFFQMELGILFPL